MEWIEDMSSLGFEGDNSTIVSQSVATRDEGGDAIDFNSAMGELDEDDIEADKERYYEQNAMVVDGFKCPNQFLNLITPMEFEEMVNIFVKFDADHSGTIDVHETKKILHFLGMDFSIDKAEELLKIVDVDGSGEIDFDEFCGFIVMIKRGDDRLKGFNSLLDKIKTTPLGELERQAASRGFKILFRVVEIRPASLVNPTLYVVEVELSGIWYTVQSGEIQGKFGVRKFQGMGNNVREAKYAAASAAIVNLGDAMPGVKYEPGEFPDDWLEWVDENLLRGVDAAKIVSILASKGFHPHRNLKLMHRILAWQALVHFLRDHPDIEPTDDAGNINEDFMEWIKMMARKGIDGEILMKLLQERCLDLKQDNLWFAQKLENNEFGSLMGLDGDPPKILDFWVACRYGYLEDVLIYCKCGAPLDEEKVDRHTAERLPPLLYAAYGGHAEVIRVLLDHGASVNYVDRRGRTAIHIAASKGHRAACEVLIEYGVRVFAVDMQGNTPLHLAAIGNHYDVVDFLAYKGQELSRTICSDKVKCIKGGIFMTLVERIFKELPIMKLKSSDTVRFEKQWLHDAAVQFVRWTDPEVRFMLPRSCKEIMEDVLLRFDPRPESGLFVTNEATGEPTFIKTIANPQDLSTLLKFVFRQAAIDSINRWHRTALHLACDANVIDSHRQIIFRLIDDYGCNVTLKDMHGRRAIDLLMMDKVVQGGPTATHARESFIMNHRQEELNRLFAEIAAEDQRRTNARRMEILEECMARQDMMDRRLWDCTRDASIPKKVYNKEWQMLEDPDTGNFFYVRLPKEGSYGDEFTDYNWEIPIEAKMYIDRTNALTYLRKIASTLLRYCGEWEVYREKRTLIDFYYHPKQERLSFDVPSELEWRTMLKQCTYTMEQLGFGNEWDVMLDPWGNKFYRNRMTKKCEYDQPLDAIVVTPAEMLCTTYQYKTQRRKQKWYTCEQCYRAWKLDNAEKLLQAANNGESNASSMAAAQQAATKNFLLCEPCIARCHSNHKGVRFMYELENNATSIYCMCVESGKITQQMCCAMQISRKQMALQLEAENMRLEQKRHRQRNIDQPPIFACVPRVDRKNVPKTRSGWQLCRQCAPPRHILNKQLRRQKRIQDGLDANQYSEISEDSSLHMMKKSMFSSSEDVKTSMGMKPTVSLYDNEDDVAQDKEYASSTNESNNTDTDSDTDNEDDAQDDDDDTQDASTQINQRDTDYSDEKKSNNDITKKKTNKRKEKQHHNKNMVVADPSIASSMAQEYRAREMNHSSEFAQLTWVEVYDMEEPEVLRFGDTVLCHRYTGYPRLTGRVRSSPKPGFYLVRFDDTLYGEDVLDRGRLELISRPRFMFNIQTGESSWSKFEDIQTFQELTARIKAFEDAQAAQMLAMVPVPEATETNSGANSNNNNSNTNMDAQPPNGPEANQLDDDNKSVFSTLVSEEEKAAYDADITALADINMYTPVKIHPSETLCLDGNEWLDLLSRSTMRRAFDDYDEMYCEELDMMFFCHHGRYQEEKCIRRLQTLFRSHFHHSFPFIAWSSTAFTFDIPSEVHRLMKVKFGWAYLRRRAQGIGEFLDSNGEEWEEYIDNKTSEYFYWQEDENLYVWDKPALFQRKEAPKNKFSEGEEVYYRFPGRYKEELSVIERVRFDDETGEDMYDVRHKVAEDQICRWVPQVAIKAILRDGEELKLAKLEQRWKDQIRRRREAEERKTQREKEQAIQYEMERLEKMKSLAFRMHGDEMEAKRTGGISLTTRLMRGRMERIALEAKILREEIDRIEGQSRREKVQLAIAEMRKELGPKFTRSAMLSMQRSLDLKYMLEEKIVKRNKLQEELQAHRQEAIARMQFIEDTLRQQEVAMTSPRSIYRRKVIRKTHVAMKRQQDLFLICEWGCGEWLKIGHEQQDHQLRRCAKRILPCTLGCDMKHTEEYWLTMFDPSLLALEAEEKDKRAKALLHSQDQVAAATASIGGKEKVNRLLLSSQQPPSSSSAPPSSAPPVSQMIPSGLGPHPSTATQGTVPRLGKQVLGSITRQQYHETQECPKRLVMCPLQCMEWVCAEVLQKHVQELCPKRPAEPFVCRLGCSAKFGGTVEQLLQAEEDRMEHENEECEFRIVRCNWVFDDGKVCAAQMRASERTAHRDYHITAMGVITYAVPGVYTFRANKSNTRLKVQLWGAGGGSGCFKERQGGSGGGGAFLEAIIDLEPYTILELTVGSGGNAGVFGKEMEAPEIGNLRTMAKTRREDTVLQSYRLADPSLKIPWYDPDNMEFIAPTQGYCGVTPGGMPGGGIGYGGGGAWACGGGGGYTSIAKKSARGTSVLLVAAGGGGGGSLPGLPGGALDGSVPGTLIDPINGTTATVEKPGEAGDTGSTFNAQWNGIPGDMWMGGYGCEFGAGGGGGYYGGGGGGTSPGLAGGGGGGSSYYFQGIVRDVVVISGVKDMPGGLQHNPPLACGVGEWDKVGGYSGQGGNGNWLKTNPGNHGAIRIIKPGHY